VARLAWDTLLALDGAGPLHQRLEAALRQAIRSGRLPTGSALPPSRVLAGELGCSRWAVTEAYGQLVAEGYLHARVGSATRVQWTPDRDRPQPAAQHRATSTQRYDLAPGLPDLAAFPRARWVDAFRSVAGTIPTAEFGYPDPAGYPALREALAEYLPRVRGAVLSAADVTVSTGVTDGATRLCRHLLANGIDTIAVEDPGWSRLRAAVRETGIRVKPIPVDADGIRVDRLGDVRAVIVAAAHQFPLGVVLAPHRRIELVEWATRVDGLVLEDDYDAEFRYDRRPVAVVQGMAPGRVALLGSLSKTLSPGLRIGWLVLPGRWRDRLGDIDRGAAASTLDQAAFARFLEQGSYDRQLRRLRQRYRARRDVLVAAINRHLPGWEIGGAAAGLHLVLTVPGDDTRLAETAARKGIRLSTLDTYQTSRGGRSGLVLGYGNIADREIAPAVRVVATAAREIGLLN
jgi:GntR family transcriptional regulator/MocR family aminotransferase